MNEPARTCLEALLVAAVALAGGLALNAVSPDGLSLTRDHFRTATGPTAGALLDGSADPAAQADALSRARTAAPHGGSSPANPATDPASQQAAKAGANGGAPATAGEAAIADGDPTIDPSAASTDAPADDPATAAVAERLRQRGLQVVTHAEARELFEDPAYAAGAYVFIDARGDDAYRAGHVPGAVQFDRYRPERHLASVMEACAGALRVIVYCIGVDCEDSELAAQDLGAFGIDPRTISVYVGGWTTWSASGLPVETGARGGGDG